MENGYKEETIGQYGAAVESNFETPSCWDMSLGAEEVNWVENNSKKGISLWQEDFMCDLELQWH